MRHKRANLAVMLICVGLSGGLMSGVARATGSEPGEDVQANAGPCIAAAAAADNDKIIDVCGALIDNEKAARPDRVKALMARAAAYDRKQMIDRAIADYDTVLKFDPSLADAHNARGELWRRKGDRPKAIMDFGAAVKLAPNHAAAKSNYKSLSLELERIGAMMAVAGKPSFDCRKRAGRWRRRSAPIPRLPISIARSARRPSVRCAKRRTRARRASCSASRISSSPAAMPSSASRATTCKRRCASGCSGSTGSTATSVLNAKFVRFRGNHFHELRIHKAH
ncbi:hypothetical protein M2199_001957 [Bradyrhizobium elkanii]|nr:hypothetical protein [Bradyrhizobium elkanii]